MADHVDVIVQIGGEDVRAGRLWSHRRRGTESATFAYETDYLSRPDAYELDPALQLVEGQQQTPEGRAMFGAFADCAPDRWGRRLILRDEQRRVRETGGTGRTFGEIEYLLGVRDDLRQGALRFRDPETGLYLADERSGVPALVELPRLLSAADHLERDQDDEEDLAVLLHGGSSLGGVRPKAHVREPSASGPAIAKFPRADADDWEVTRWEAVALELAGQAGIWVPESRLVELGGRAALIVRRFDRERNTRIGYVSAMTMLEAKDGDTGSYLDIAGVVETHSPSATEDLRQLWRRIAFSILISNTDDHLRNHGFLRRSTAGWSLSPVFDLNPDPSPGVKHLNTAITFDDTEARLDTLLEVADVFRLSPDDARAALTEVSSATARWRSVAESVGLKKEAIEQMAPAFEHEQAEIAGRMQS
jgi:serine/threonine-protein kinase HipA